MRLPVLASSILALAACHAGAVVVAPAAPAATHASIASALALVKGQPVTVGLPCHGRVYVGPFAFTHDPEQVKVLYSNKSNSGAQVCTGGTWVDDHDVAIGGNAGTGCVEGASPTTGYIEHTHSPGNGGDGATPAYFFLQIGDGGGAPGCEASTITLTLQ